jgi:hypothetical protein
MTAQIMTPAPTLSLPRERGRGRSNRSSTIRCHSRRESNLFLVLSQEHRVIQP